MENETSSNINADKVQEKTDQSLSPTHTERVNMYWILKEKKSSYSNTTNAEDGTRMNLNMEDDIRLTKKTLYQMEVPWKGRKS